MSENTRTPAAAARALRPLILSAREETENARALAPTVVAALLEANLFRLAVPAAHGGLEASPLEALDVYEELAGAEASAAFVVWNNSLPALLSRFLADDVRHALFGDPATITANSAARRRVAVESGDRRPHAGAGRRPPDVAVSATSRARQGRRPGGRCGS